jgi:hypothetical protein
VARLDIGERQGQEPRQVVAPEALAVAARPPADDRLVLGQLVGGDERELLEQRVPGRQAAEDLDHRLGDLRAHGGELLGDALGLQRLAEGSVLGKSAPDQGPRGRDAEQEILADRRLVVVALGIERLDELGHP